MAAFRIVQKTDQATQMAVGWYVERATDDGRTEIVTPLYLKKWEAQAEAELLSAKDAGHYTRTSNRGI
jgi:hypothetical protein